MRLCPARAGLASSRKSSEPRRLSAKQMHPQAGPKNPFRSAGATHRTAQSRARRRGARIGSERHQAAGCAASLRPRKNCKTCNLPFSLSRAPAVDARFRRERGNDPAASAGAESSMHPRRRRILHPPRRPDDRSGGPGGNSRPAASVARRTSVLPPAFLSIAAGTQPAAPRAATATAARKELRSGPELAYTLGGAPIGKRLVRARSFQGRPVHAYNGRHQGHGGKRGAAEGRATETLGQGNAPETRTSPEGRPRADRSSVNERKGDAQEKR